MDKRFLLLKQYAINVFGEDVLISNVSDDASFRRYFRLRHNDNSYVIMDAPPEKENTESFVRIAQFFHQGGVNTPRIYHQNLELGFLILSDFGDITLLKKNTLELYILAIDELIKIQALPQNSLPKYSSKILTAEMLLCKEWFDKTFFYDDIFAVVLENINKHKHVVVHRDYHSRNIMVDYNTLGIIDFQDAIAGSYVYDLASLLRDAYIELSPQNVERLQQYYFNQVQLDDYDAFITDFDMIATQRHLKILGIFKRLSNRDGKHDYLKDIPQVQKYLLNMSKKYSQLRALEELCKQ